MGRRGDDESVSPYLGDFPDGAYWSAERLEVSADARAVPDTVPPDRVPPGPPIARRTPASPYPIRMFAEIGCTFALWGEIDEPPPTQRQGGDEWNTLEEELPISAGLRDALLSWADEFFRWDGGERTIPMDDFTPGGSASAVSCSASSVSCTP